MLAASDSAPRTRAPLDRTAPAGAVSRRIAILGDGQLGFMLCQAARDLGLEAVVVSPDGAGPAVGAAHDVIVSAMDAPGLVDALAARVDAVTFEIEAIPAALLRDLQAASRDGRLRVGPDAGILLRLQNKAAQKHWLIHHGLPTLPFRVLSGGEDARHPMLRAFGSPLVQKTQRGGYDGQGVQILRDAAALERLWPVPSLVEPCLEEKREISVVLARGAAGDVRCYGPVEMIFEDRHNVLESVTSPAPLSPAIAGAATTIAEQVVTRLEGVGVFAVEMFLTPEDELLVNEVSPRVHNTGHHTIEACATSQFEQHLRAVAGLPLGDVADERPAVMQNLLYRDALEPLLGAEAGVQPTPTPGTFVHWYGKTEARPFRKMGHVTSFAADPAAGLRRAQAAVESLVAPARIAAA